MINILQCNLQKNPTQNKNKQKKLKLWDSEGIWAGKQCPCWQGCTSQLHEDKSSCAQDHSGPHLCTTTNNNSNNNSNNNNNNCINVMASLIFFFSGNMSHWDTWHISEVDVRKTLPFNEGLGTYQTIHAWCCEPYKDSDSFHSMVCPTVFRFWGTPSSWDNTISHQMRARHWVSHFVWALQL